MAKILVVDDSRMARNLVCAPLEEAGHEVLGVEPSSIFDVLKQIHAFLPDLVITDYQMPKCNGEALVHAIRADRNVNQTPVMLLTAHRDEELIQRLGHLGISGCHFKDQGMPELVRRVATILN